MYQYFLKRFYRRIIGPSILLLYRACRVESEIFFHSTGGVFLSTGSMFGTTCQGQLGKEQQDLSQCHHRRRNGHSGGFHDRFPQWRRLADWWKSSESYSWRNGQVFLSLSLFRSFVCRLELPSSAGHRRRRDPDEPAKAKEQKGFIPSWKWSWPSTTTFASFPPPIMSFSKWPV